jgi:hypothetical protein
MGGSLKLLPDARAYPLIGRLAPFRSKETHGAQGYIAFVAEQVLLIEMQLNLALFVLDEIGYGLAGMLMQQHQNLLGVYLGTKIGHKMFLLAHSLNLHYWLPAHDGIAQRAELVDADMHHVTGLQCEGWIGDERSARAEDHAAGEFVLAEEIRYKLVEAPV